MEIFLYLKNFQNSNTGAADKQTDEPNAPKHMELDTGSNNVNKLWKYEKRKMHKFT